MNFSTVTDNLGLLHGGLRHIWIDLPAREPVYEKSQRGNQELNTLYCGILPIFL